MVTIKEIETGVGSYLDNELMPMLGDGGLQKVLIGAGISMLLHKNMNKLSNLQSNPLIAAMEIFDQDGNVDIDSIQTEISAQMPAEGVKIDVPLVGTLTFKKEDISKLHQYIMNAAGKSSSSSM